ncbi:MAG: site-specific DNA-methyltransferase [Sporolactobacillus sp.]
MIIKKIPISSINPALYNPRLDLKPGDPEYEKLKRSIQEFGYVDPLIWNKQTGNLIGGHQRLKILESEGEKEVEVSVVDLDDQKEKALNIALNKISGEWDMPKLKDLLEELDDGEFDLELTGFDLQEVEDLMTQFSADDESPGAEEDDFDVDENIPDDPVTKRGDIWKIGRHRLMCGDSINQNDVEQLMNGERADLLITDPPYNIDYEGKTKEKLKIQNDKQDSSSFRKFLADAFQSADEVMKNGAAFYIWHAGTEGFNFIGACQDVGWVIREVLIWVKNTLVMGRQDYQWQHEPCLYGWKDGASHFWNSDRKQTTVLEFDKPQRSNLHPTMKPVALFDYQIKNSTKKGNNVLDLFGGSGTTLIACEQNERNAFLMELDERYCDVIIKRWEEFTGEKAVLENVH